MARRLVPLALAGVLLAGTRSASADAPATIQESGRPVPLNGGPASARALIAAVTQGLPLLAPAEAGRRAATTLLVGSGWYATTTRHDGVVVTLHALRTTHAHTGLRSEVESSGGLAPLRVHESHSIWSASWEIGEVAVVLDLECEQGPGDARCSSEAFLLDWVGTLVAVGGEQ